MNSPSLNENSASEESLDAKVDRMLEIYGAVRAG